MYLNTQMGNYNDAYLLYLFFSSYVALKLFAYNILDKLKHKTALILTYNAIYICIEICIE